MCIEPDALQMYRLTLAYMLQGDSHTEAFRCIEMQEGRAWGWGIDAFGVCSTIHCLLFGDYMQVEKTISPEGESRQERQEYGVKGVDTHFS